MIIRKVIALITFVFCTKAIAQDDFKVVVGLPKPPYVIQDSNSGFEIELVREVLQNINKRVEFVYVPYGRSNKMLDVDDINAVMTVNSQIFPKNALLSDSYVTYQNVAISLKRNKFSINKIADLGDYSIATFQLAHKVLGQEFASAVEKSPLFIQVADQKKQLELLILGRVDTLVMDIHIFQYYLVLLDLQHIKNQIIYHKVFPESPYRIAFKKEKDLKAFNTALGLFKKTGAYAALKYKYNF